MRKLRVLPTLLLAAFAVSLGLGPPAHAKGPTSAEVTGPGIDTTSVTYTERRGDVDLNTMVRGTGIFTLYGGGRLAEPELSERELGPRYIVTWQVGSTAMTVTHVYPFADGGAWVYHPYEQGRWVRGGPHLERAMVELGAERPRVDVEPRVSTSSTAVGPAARTEVAPVASSASTPRTTGRTWLAALVAGAVLVGGGWLVRRRATADGNALATAMGGLS